MGEVRQGGISEGGEDTAEQLSVEEMVDRYQQVRGELSGAVDEFKQAQNENERVLSELIVARDAESAALTTLGETKQRVIDEINGIATAIYEDPSLSDLDKAVRLMAARDCRDVLKGSDPVVGGSDYTDRVVGYHETVERFNEILPAYRGQAVVKVAYGHVIVGRLESVEVRGVNELSGYPQLPEGSLEVDAPQVAVYRDRNMRSSAMANGRVFDSEFDIHEGNAVRLDKIVYQGQTELDTEEAVERELIYLGNDAAIKLIEALNRGEDGASYQLLYELWIAASKAGVDLEELVPDMAGEISEWRAQTKKTLVSQAASIAYGFAVNNQYSNQFLEPGMEVWKPADLIDNAELIEALGLNREEIITDTLSLLKQSENSRVSSLVQPTVLALLRLTSEE